MVHHSYAIMSSVFVYESTCHIYRCIYTYPVCVLCIMHVKRYKNTFIIIYYYNAFLACSESHRNANQKRDWSITR